MRGSIPTGQDRAVHVLAADAALPGHPYAPFTLSVCPAMYEAAGEQRNTAAAATGDPGRLKDDPL